MRHIALFFVLFISATLAAAEPALRSWTIDGIKRDALLSVPSSASSTPAPVVFVFHGHGGTMNHSSTSFHFHTLWPQAIIIYMQGLPTASKLVDPEGKMSGWQMAVGKEGDRDLKFFDAVLASLNADYKIDDKRIYCTGHSNGGSFTYLLWSARGDVFAAVAPSAATAPYIPQLKPKPCLHVAGTHDTLVKYTWQQLGMNAVRKLNNCESEGKPWLSDGDLKGTIYASSTNTPFISLISPGTHKYPPQAPALIAKFFQQYAKP